MLLFFIAKMAEILLETIILAPIQLCFDLSRSIDLHKLSLEHTNEKAIDGKTSGLIEKDEFVTWQAKHFGFNQKLTIKIVEMNPPNYFCDEMTKGTFKSMRHEHFFEEQKQGILVTDKFYYEMPFGILGKTFNVLFLKNYLTQLLKTRNQSIKKIAESTDWKKIIGY